MERSEGEPAIPAAVELGVGNGDYCRSLVNTGNRNVWAYDTFDGAFPLETVGEGENRDAFSWGGQSSNSTVRASLESVGVTCVTGIFPETFPENHPTSVSFVHVDMDTYMSTEAALRLFHPLMEEGGVFLIHDYNNGGMPGVRRAVDEFKEAHSYEYEFNPNVGDHYHMRKR
jgi:hypothetical protein